MRIVVNKHRLVYLDFRRAGSISLQLYLTCHRLLHVRVAVNSHALPVHKKNRITSLLCIFETIIICVLELSSKQHRPRREKTCLLGFQQSEF